MTINQSTVCNLIQTFPVLLILAQKQNRCLETHFVYKPPTPTQSPEYYMALDALFQNLYGHGYPGSHDSHEPCNNKYGKPCPGYPEHGYHYDSHGTFHGSQYVPSTSYGSHGIGYGSHGTGYGSHGTGYGSYGAGYSSHGAGYGSPGVHFVPSYKKGNIYNGNITYGHGYASTQNYKANNRYKIVVKKTRIGTKRKRKSEKLQAGGKRCSAVNGGEGKCISLRACQPYQMIKDAVSNPVTTWLLRQAHCGFDGDSPKVCCPIDDPQDGNTNQIEPITPGIPEKEVKRTTLPPTTSILPPTSTLPPITSTLPPKTSTLPPKTSTLPPTTSTLPLTTSTLPPTTTTSPRTTSTLPPTTVPPGATTRISKPPPMKYDLSLFGDTCNTVYNTTGSCKDVYLCEPLLALAKTAPSNPAAAAVLKQAACGFRKNIPQVCCPLPVPIQTLPEMTTAIPSTVKRVKGDFLTALPEPPVCGLSNVSLDRVVGGIPAKLGAFPWMALLGYRDLSIQAGLRWMCGGALISTRHVLTAAHCIHNQEDNIFIVRLGELDIDREDDGATPLDVPIKSMYKHESYTKNDPVINDIGVLVLAKDVEFTDLIKPICLFTATTNMWISETFEDYNPFIAGWGATTWEGISATHLQVAQVPVLSAQKCENAYQSNLRAKTRTQFAKRAMCAGYLAGKIDSCSGDSGGPLMMPIEVEGLNPKSYFFAIGVVSFGRQCAQAGFPGVYARLSHYMPWVEEKVLGRTS